MLQPDGAGFAAYLEGEPVDAEIRGAEVTARVSAVSAVPVVREWINSRLRAMVRAGRDVVVDGRDIGTVVFPDAELKIFLTASPEARAGRRHHPARAGRWTRRGWRPRPRPWRPGTTADSTRAVAPLVAAADAVPLDTTAMTFAEQVRFIVELARPIFGCPLAGPAGSTRQCQLLAVPCVGHESVLCY